MQITDLKAMSAAQVARHNQEVQFLSRRVYAMAGASYLFEKKPSVIDGLTIAMSCGGQDFAIGLSQGLVDLMFNHFGINQAELSEEWLDFLVRSQLPALLPANFTVKGLIPAIVFEDVYVAKLYGSSEDMGLAIGVFGHPNPIAAATLLDGALAGVVASPFANTPIALPLIASTFEVPAGDLQDLQVGDVLLV